MFIDAIVEESSDSPEWECQSCPGSLEYTDNVRIDSGETRHIEGGTNFDSSPTLVTLRYDTVIFANCSSAKQKSLVRADDVLLAEAGIYMCAGMRMKRFVDGGAILEDDCQTVHDAEN